MKPDTSQTATKHSELLAFLGNSLLLPMNQTERLGLQPSFWEWASEGESETVRRAAERCASVSAELLASEGSEDAAMHRASVEYTKLFIGPPKPAAPPWETYYLAGDCVTGFGEPTFDVRQVMADHGIISNGPHHQLEDHMGIELHVLSQLCNGGNLQDAVSFAEAHPCSWIDKLTEAVDAQDVSGYYGSLLRLAKAVMLDMIASR